MSTYRVTYLRQPWSQQYEMPNPDPTGPDPIVTHPTGEVTIDCGTARNVEDFVEGVMPGTYLFTPINQLNGLVFFYAETFPVIVAHPDAPSYERIVADVL